jgi:hypothetical protein
MRGKHKAMTEMRSLLLSPNPDPSSDPQMLCACCEVQLQTALWVFGHGRHNGERAWPQTPTAYTKDSGPPDHRSSCANNPPLKSGFGQTSGVGCQVP